jgi:DNA-directed RNA polymerase III subunit RPC4
LCLLPNFGTVCLLSPLLLLLLLLQDDPEGATAAQLGLTDLSTAADTLYLFQLPSLLPLGTNPSADPRKARSAAAAAAAAGSSSGQQQQPLQAANARELPSGQIGKLLVFKSGRVKLQMGPCLLDVSAGMPCVTRQDIAAINKTTGHLIQLGPVTQRVVVCPDVWQLMDDKAVPEFRRDLQQQQHGPLTNGFGRADRGDRMDLDDDEIEEGGELQDEDMGNGVGGGQPKQQRQQVLGGPDLSEDGEGDEQQQGRQEGRQRRLAQQIGSSSEGEADGSQSPVPAAAAAAGGEADAEQQQQQQQQQQQSSAASRAPPRQPNQQQQQFVRNNWLDLPTAPARGAAAGRGRGKFRPSTRSPSPGLAAAAAAAAGSSGLLKQENAMDVDS